jgi:hypothetical protein
VVVSEFGRGLFEKSKRGYYDLTDNGRDYLAGDLDVDNL